MAAPERAPAEPTIVLLEHSESESVLALLLVSAILEFFFGGFLKNQRAIGGEILIYIYCMPLDERHDGI